MFEKFGRRSAQTAVAALLAALGVGGVAAAKGGGTTTKPTHTPAAKVQSSDPSGPNDKADTSGATDPAGPNDQADGPNDKADGPEKAEAPEKGEAPEKADGADADGPGGHHDEPGNPNANTQQQGQH